MSRLLFAGQVMTNTSTLVLAVVIVIAVIIGVQLSGYGNCCDLR